MDQAAAGQDVVISRDGKPLVCITQLDNSKRPIKFGVLKGKLRLAPSFDELLPAPVLASFEAG